MMLVNNLQINIANDDGDFGDIVNLNHFPIDKIENLLQVIKDSESEIGYTSFKVVFNVYDYHKER